METKKQRARFVFDNAYKFKNLLKVLEVMMDEWVLELTPEGLIGRSMDASRCAMLDFKLDKESMEEFDVPKAVKFCFDVEEVVKKLKKVSKCEKVVFTVTDHLHITLKERFPREFTFPLLEFEYEEIPKPKIPDEWTKTKILAADLAAIMEDLSDHAVISTTQNSITFAYEEEEDFRYAAKLEYGKNDSLLQIKPYKEDRRSVHSVSYLEEIVKALNRVVDILEVSVNTDMPLRIKAYLAYGCLDFWLAPRIGVE